MCKQIIVDNHNEDYVTWEMFLSRGFVFLKTYWRIEERISILFYPVNFYLLSHALELFLKGGLRRKTYSLKQIEDYGHDLVSLFKEVNSVFKLSVDQDRVERIKLLNKYYENKDLEYCGSGGLGLPRINEIEKIAVVYGEICGVSAISLDKSNYL